MPFPLARGITSLFFPAVCAGCRCPIENGPSLPVCETCQAALPRCRFPGGPLGAVDGTLSPFLYEGVLRELVLALKYEGRTSLIPFLAEQMAQEILRSLGNPPTDLLLPVPLHPVRLRERGFNQAELLARALAEKLGIPCEADLLIRCRPTLPQKELTRPERTLNVRGAFDLRSGTGLEGSHVLLVDDLLTTGVTAQACAALLKKAGARSVRVVTAARD